MTTQEAYKALDLAFGIDKIRIEAKFNQLKKELDEKILNTSNDKLKGIFVNRLYEVETAFAVLLEHFQPVNQPIEKKALTEIQTEPIKSRRYYFSNGTEKNGPVSLDELKKQGVEWNTLIWYEGLSDWKEARDVEELDQLCASIPPPIKQSMTSPDNSFSTGLNNPSLSGSSSLSTNPSFAQMQDFTPSQNLSASSSSNLRASSQSMFSNPFSFNGRIRRTEFGLSLIFYMVLYFFLSFLIIDSYGSLDILGLLLIPMVWFLWAQGAKRCHDLGNSGWWQLIPFYVFWLIFQDGQPGVNEYGNNPKE